MEGEDGYILPKYEIRYVEHARGEYIEDDIVLFRETTSFDFERIYHVPTDVVEDAARLLTN